MKIILVQTLQALLSHLSVGEMSLSTASANVPPSKRETKFHTDTKKAGNIIVLYV